MTISSNYRPEKVSKPGDTLQELLRVHNLSQADLAERIGRSKKTINEIVQGKTTITPDTAILLERVFQVSAMFWLNREASFRANVAEREDDLRLSDQLEDLKKFPVRSMIKNGWIEDTKDKLKQLKHLLSFFGVDSIDRIPQIEQVAFRKSDAYATDPWALAAWLRAGERAAIKQNCSQFDRNKVLSSLKRMRSLTIEDSVVFVPELTRLCNDCGIAITFVRELPKTNVSGATRWITPDLAHLQLSLRYKTNDHFWFSFFHELGHIYFEHAKRETLLENNPSKSLDVREMQANEFANEHLIPKADLERLLQRNLTTATIQAFARELKIAPGIVVGRLQHEDRLQYHEMYKLKIPLNWDTWPGA